MSRCDQSDAIIAVRFRPLALRVLLAGPVALAGLVPAVVRADDASQVVAAASVDSAAISEVIVTARRERHEQEFQSDQSTKVLDQDQIRASSVVGGSAQAIALVPGVSVASYGATGSSKTTISIDGIKIGWAGFSGGNPDNGSLAVTFDGVPMNNPGNGLWQSTLVPQTSILASMGVTYGPGQAVDRWYTNIGGSLDFAPAKPTAQAGGEVAITYGSFDTRNVSFTLQSGDLGGWQTVLAGGVNAAHSFMTAPDGFTNDSANYAYYLKSQRTLDNGVFSLGAYIARSTAYRPLATPVSPIPGVSINGYQQPGPLFSQQTTGFYETLPGSVNFKLDTNAIAMLWSHLDLNLGQVISLHNLTYLDYEHRLHWTPLHDFVPGSESIEEENRPSSYVLGDKLYYDFKLPYNDLIAGGFVQVSRYHSREQLYNPSLGFVQSPVPVPAGLTGSVWAPNGQYFSDWFEQLDSALFLQDTISPIPTLLITPGIRFIDYVTRFYHDEASQFPLAVLYNPGGQLSQFPSAHTAFTRGEPSVGVNWQALPTLALYGNYARAYRQPENGGGTGPYVAIPASAVQLEYGDDYIGGVKVKVDRFGPASDISLDASYSHLDYQNETIPTALASGGALLAYGSSTYDAENIFAEASPVKDLYVFANAGFVRATFTNFTNSTGTYHHIPVPNTPDANFNLGLYYKWHVGETLVQPRLTYQYTGGQHVYDNSQNITSNVQLPAFGVFNLSTQVDVPLRHVAGLINAVSFGIEVDNLLNKQYNSFEYVSAGGLYGAGGYTNPATVGAGSLLALPAPPRAVYGTVSVRF